MNYSRYVYFETLINELVNFIAWAYPSNSRRILRRYLEETRQGIRHKREQIYSKQNGGEWAITSGDRIFLQYLDHTEAIINSVIKNWWLTKWNIQNVKTQLMELHGKLNTDHNPRIKVVFLAQETSVWPSFESVYQAFASDPRCETQLIYLPFEHVNNDKNIDWFKVYKTMGLPIQNCLNYNLSEEAPDLAFFAKPYGGIPTQFSIDNVSLAVERCVYIPYWVNWMALQNLPFLIDYHYQLPFFDKVWKIFDAPDYVRASHVKYSPKRGENLELVGHPRFDAVGNLERKRESIPSDWRRKISNKMVIMWNTHSYIATGKEENWSTFGILGRQLLEYFRTCDGLVLLWRPHPHFFNSHINGGMMTDQEVDELKNLASMNSNIILDTTPDYLSAFSVADTLISDASSLLVEFLATCKPVLYTYNESSYSIVNKNLLPALYTANTWGEVEEFIQKLIDGMDDKLSERRKVVETFMPNVSKNVGELVRDKCITDLIAEEINSAKELSQKYRKGFLLK